MKPAASPYHSSALALSPISSAVPAGAVVDQAGVLEQRRRDQAHRRVGRRPAHQAEAGERQQAMAVVDPREQTSRLILLFFPEQPVEPGDVVLGPQRLAVEGEE